MALISTFAALATLAPPAAAAQSARRKALGARPILAGSLDGGELLTAAMMLAPPKGGVGREKDHPA